MARKTKATLNYQPHPKQALLHECPANEILYGGAAGPGKSHALRMDALMWCQRIPNLQVYLFRRTFPELEKNHIIPSKMQFPKELGHYSKQDKRWEFTNGSMLHFCHAQYEDDVMPYLGAEIHMLYIDELTTFTEFQYTLLRSRNRCPMKIPDKYRHKIPATICASNPGGVGHSFVKRRWVDGHDPLEVWQAPNNEGGMLRCYIPGLLKDNPTLMENDPGYVHNLDALMEPYRTAYKEGNWDIFFGQAFNFSERHHVIRPRPVPEDAPIYWTFDWGFVAPFSMNWLWVDHDNRLYLFDEWYGWNGTPAQGLRLPDSEIARRTVDKEERMGIAGRDIRRLAGPDCWHKKPTYLEGGQGPTTAEAFARAGLHMSPGNPQRVPKIREFHQRLHVPDDGTRPMLQVYDTCEHFIRTIPLLQSDSHNIEDIDTNGEDHVYDSVCHAMMARAKGAPPSEKTYTRAQRDRMIVEGRWEEKQGVETYDFYGTGVGQITDKTYMAGV